MVASHTVGSLIRVRVGGMEVAHGGLHGDTEQPDQMDGICGDDGLAKDPVRRR
jgi:hypothetical protein